MLTLPRAWISRLPMALAVSLDLQAADPIYAGRIRAAQIAAIIRLTPVAMGASCLNAGILLLTLWSVGSLTLRMIVWAILLVAVALRYVTAWAARGRRDPARPASRRALRRTVVNGILFGVLWGAVPVMIFPHAATSIQLLVGCVSAGMMCAGGFVLGTVPRAALGYVAMVLIGSYYALLAAGLSKIHLGLVALLTVYGAVVAVNLTWNADLFVQHFLAEALLKEEVIAREKAQAQVAHAQRMTALGELAGGIAHDFNNILQSVVVNASLVARRADDTAQIQRLSGLIMAAADRGGAISRRLLAFARQDTLNPAPVDAAELLAWVHEMIQQMLARTMELRLDLPPGLPHLRADQAQLETILLNLAHNARDAMPGGGTITLSAAAVDMSGPLEHPALRPGAYVRLDVADTGCGMDPAILARATDPFFTTKPKGKGTGLGLAMAKGFAEQSGGALAISSTPGEGTRVSLWLPQTDAPVARPLPAAGKPRRVLSQHVLIVDDDSEVRHSLMRSLQEAGFTVSGAWSAETALEKLDCGLIVDVIVSDFAMDGMNGVDFIRAARARRPGLPAILLTGQVGEVPQAQGGPFVLLQKPVRLSELVDQLAASG